MRLLYIVALQVIRLHNTRNYAVKTKHNLLHLKTYFIVLYVRLSVIFFYKP